MAKILIHSDSASSATSVSNIFIDEYMSDANGEFVKIYLYLLRQLNAPDAAFSISAMADKFEHTEKESSGIIALISSFKKSGYKSLGIVCKTEAQAKELAESLQTYTAEVYFLSNQSSAFVKGIIVTSSHMAKGLEFDEVIIPYVNDKNYNSAIDKSMLYVAVTRAMHKLTLTYNGKLSEFVPAFKL